MHTMKAVGSKGGAVALLLTGILATMPALASATTTGPTGTSAKVGVTGTSGASGAKGLLGSSARFSAQQQRLEQNTAIRQAQLVKLTAMVTGATNTLTSADKSTLTSRLASETTSVNEVAAHVPTDTTPAQLLADAQQLYNANRVFAIMTPQVNLTNRADAELAKVATLQTELGASGSATIASALTTVSASISAAHTLELAQTPQAWPGNQPQITQARNALTAAAAQLKIIAQEIRAAARAAAKAAKTPKTGTNRVGGKGSTTTTITSGTTGAGTKGSTPTTVAHSGGTTGTSGI